MRTTPEQVLARVYIDRTLVWAMLQIDEAILNARRAGIPQFGVTLPRDVAGRSSGLYHAQTDQEDFLVWLESVSW
jgi:hypothetical protein